MKNKKQTVIEAEITSPTCIVKIGSRVTLQYVGVELYLLLTCNGNPTDPFTLFIRRHEFEVKSFVKL